MGKGDEASGTHWEGTWPGDGEPLAAAAAHEFSAPLPKSPHSYDGRLLQVRWYAKLLVRRGRRQEPSVEIEFRLGPTALNAEAASSSPLP